MVFNSFEFIFIYLPVAYLGFLAAHHIGGWSAAVKYLAVASLAFYGVWGLPLLAVLFVSLVLNYAAGNLISCLNDKPAAARNTLIAGIAGNLALLGYLKYSNFFIDIANQATGAGVPHLQLMASIGVSFYTFIQIGYLIDSRNSVAQPQSFFHYIVFAAFFPCVTAGPLVFQREISGQLENRTDRAFSLARLGTGMTMFGMGLFKKTFLADSIGPFADAMFNGVAAGGPVDLTTAWVGSICYALQLYFDFSGYSDMAMGLAFIFGIRLPLNFDSPFKATSISDFWRRWHITMTRFFTSYVYSALAVNGMRTAMSRQAGRLEKFVRAAAAPVIVTFLIAGVWHGAGWSFALYGLLHGTAIAVNLAWREFRLPKLPAAAGWALTMSVVFSGLVIFRAPDLATAGTILASMWDVSGLFAERGDLQAIGFNLAQAASLAVLLGAIVLFLPNTQQIMHHDWLSSDEKPAAAPVNAGLIVWRPALAGAFAMGFAFTIALTSIGANSKFLYYQF